MAVVGQSPKPEFVPFDPVVYGKGLPNPDETTTPGSLQADIHYATLGIQGAWNRERVLRLCGWLRITRHELASFVMLPHTQMDKYIERDLFPGPVALLFTLIENQFMPDVLMDAIPSKPETPVMPNSILFNGPSQEA